MKNFNLIEMAKAMKEHKLRHMWRYAAMMALLLTLACGQAWGDDYTETYSNPTGTNPPARANGMGAFTTITPDGTKVTFGNSSLQIGTASASGTFTISSTDGSYITGITFTQNGSYPVGTLTSSDGTVTGPSTNVFTFTPSTSTKTSCSFSMTASASKTRIPTIVVSLSSNYEYFSKNFTISSGTVSCTKSNAKTDVTITSTGGTSNNGLTLASSGNALTIASSGHNIKAVHFTCESHSTMSNLSANTGTYSSNGWTKSTATNTVTFTSSGSNATIVGISVELEAGCTSISPSLSYTSTSLMVGDDSSSPTLTGNTGSGTVTWTSSDEDVATVNESTGVVTAVAAGTATITASIAANGGYCNGSATANFTITRDPVGEDHVLTWPLTTVSGSSESNVDGGTTDIGTGTAKSTSSYITNQTDLTGVGVKRTTTGKNSNTGKIETPTSYDAAKYVSFTFDVEDGYQFTPTEVSIKTVAVSTAKDLKFEFSDAKGSYSVTKENLSTSSAAATNTLDFSECNVDFTGTVTVKIYVYGATDAYRLSTPLTITGDVAAVAAAGCSAYEFHYGTHGEDDWETACFEQVGETNEWKIEDFTIPSTTHFYVGYHGDGTNGWNDDWSAEKAWTDAFSDGNGAMVLLPTSSSKVGLATGATGTLTIWSNSGDKNKFVGFKPDGYAIMYGGNNYAFSETATANMLETDVVTLPNVGSTTYQMGIKTASSYTTCAHSSAAEAISAMSKTDLEGGNKKVYLDPNKSIWDSDGSPKYAVRDVTNSSWGVGGSDFMTDPDGDGIYEGYVADDCTQLYFARINPSDDTPSDGWNHTEYQSVSAPNSNFQNKYTIASWSDGYGGSSSCSGPVAMSPTTGDKGKFRMWANSSSNNWYVHFIPHYVLTYDANGGSDAPETDYTSIEDGSITISATEPTRTGYNFLGWATTNDAASADGDYDPEDEVTLSDDVTLYAVWECITPDAPTADKITVTPSCAGTGATFSANTTGVPSYVTWYWQTAADGTSTSNAASSDYTTATSAGTYTMYLRAKNTECGTWSASGSTPSKSVKVKTAVTASWDDTPANGIKGGSMTASVTTNYADGVTYSVTSASPAGCVTVGETSGVISYVAAGTATITATVTGAGDYCSTASVNQSITVSTLGVTYDKNNGSATGSSSDATGYSLAARVTVKDQGTMALTGYTFVGWNTEDDGSGTYYSPGANFVITENTTLYAQWRDASGTTCPDDAGGTVFSLSMGSSVTSSDLSISAGETKNLSSYATITNGAAHFTNINTSSVKAKITKDSPNKLSFEGKDAMLVLYLDCALEEGDEISFTGTDNQISFTTTPSRSTTPATTSKSYTIPAESSLIGAHILYVWRSGDSNPGITALTITRPADCTTPDAPDGLTVSAKTTTSATLSISDDADVNNYEIYYSTESDAPEASTVASETTTSKSITISGLTVGTTYYAWVRSVCDEDHKSSWVAASSFSTLHQYTMSYNKGTGDGISGSQSNQTKTEGTSFTLPGVVFTRSGYVQTGWTTSDGGTQTHTLGGSYTTDAAQTFYPVWSPVYTVTFNTNGTGSVSPITQSTYEGSITMPSGPSSTDSTFLYWVIGENTYAASASYTPTSNITAYAAWKEKCSGGGGGSSITNVVATGYTSYQEVGGSNVVFFSAPSIGLKYKTLDGTTINNSTDVATHNNAYSCQIKSSSSNKGSIKTNSSYSNVDSISFYFAGSDKSSCQIAVLYSTDNFDKDSTTLLSATAIASGGSNNTFYKKVLALPAAKKANNLTFKFRFTVGGSGKTSYIDSLKVYTSTGGGTCYYVKYDGNGAESGSINDATAYTSSSNSVTVLGNTGGNAFVRDGYTFNGWNTKANGSGDSKTAGGTFTITKDTVLYAQWLDAATTYTISTSATNGTIAVTVGGESASSAEEDATVTITATPSSGYSFSSWTVTDEDEGSVTVTSSTTNPTTFTMPAKAVTVSATFTPNTYDITYNLNGASWAGEYSAPAEYTVGTGATLPVAGNMTNTGYTFGGWYDNSGLTGSSVTTIGTSEYGNKEYWAKWTENTYTITYDANGGTGSTSSTVGHYVTVANNGFTAPDGKVFAGWNTASGGGGDSYGEGDEIELTANMTLYAIWASDYDITWDDSPKLSGVAAKPNLGGGNYTITASVATWTGSLTTSMISAETSGVTITGVSVDNSASPKTITATFNVGATVVGDKISFTLDVPANGSYSAKSDTEDFDIDRCTGSSSGSDGVLFSAEFKDSGLGTSDICTAANTPYTFTTAELKAAPTGGSIKASTTSTLSHMKFATNAISIAGSDGVIQIDLSNAIATNDLFTYVNVNSSSSSAYLRHTSPTTTTDQIALTVYNSKEAKVRLTSGFNGETTLYIVRNSGDFKLHKAAVVRPAFLMLLRDDTPTSDTNLEGTDQELTTENYLTTINGGRAYYTSPSSGNLKIKRSSSKNYINFNNTAGYVKIVLNDALQEGDVIGFDSYNTNNLALTTTATRSTSIVTTNQLYTVDASSDLKGATTFYLWQNSGSSDFLRGLQIARSGVAGGGGGTDKITTTLTWDADLSGGVAAETGDADFTHTVTQDKNSLGAITYSSSNTSVATVNASGKVHIAGAGNATITATMAASGCYKEATVSYNITVTDNCADVAGTISTEDLDCSSVRLTVTGHTAAAGVEYQWYKDGGAIGGATSDNYTATDAGEYYVVVTNTGDGHCEKASTNTITLEDSEAATASKIVNSWYVKNGRRTPDIALVQTENATDFTVTSGGSPITTFAGCAFYLGTDGIIYLKGQQEDDSAPTGLTSGDETLKFTATACGGNSSELSITIHKQESTARPSVAFVVDGTKGGDFDEEEENHSVNTELYQYLDYGADETGAFDLTGQNVYSTVDEQAIREHYSQFDAILITDDPSTDTKSGKKSYVDAFGTMIDVRPILTMEAFVSKWGNWKAKGIDGNPESPNPRQYKMKLQCKDHAIFKGLSVGTNVETETIDDVEYWTVTMVDNTKSPYSGVADGTDTNTKPALQGFSADDVSSLLLLGEISEGSLYAGVERQEETAARLMLLGLNAKALPNALTPEGKKVIENALKYLIETDLEKVDDCSNYFTGGASGTDTDWNKDSNWSKGHVPNSPNVRVRILSECVINSGTYKVAEVDIATSGKSLNKASEMTGKLTINADAALIVGGKIRTAKAPYFNTGDLMPTTEEDLVINTSSTAQAALIFDNDAGDTKATVNLYSLGRKESGSYYYQYMAVPMESLPVNPSFAGSGIYTYVWNEASGWERRGYYTDLYAFEGVGITTKFADAKTYEMKGTLASTETREIALTNDKNGQNMIGNSWTAPIQIADLEEDNSASEIIQTVYIYSTGNGNTVSDGTTASAGQWLAIPFSAAGFEAWGGLKVIPAMQTFNINVTGTSTLTLDYDKVVRKRAAKMSVDTLTTPLHAPKRSAAHEGVELMRIRVEDSQTHTDLYLFKGERFSDEFDNGWEAEYLNGDGRSAKLYAQTEIGKMAVVATDELEGTVLGFEPGKETEYTFTFGGEGMGYYLNDLKLKKSTWINAGETYSFTYEEGDINRFIISTTPITTIMTGCESVGAEAAKVRKVIIDDKVYIIRGGRIYSVDGQMVK